MIIFNIFALDFEDLFTTAGLQHIGFYFRILVTENVNYQHWVINCLRLQMDVLVLATSFIGGEKETSNPWLPFIRLIPPVFISVQCASTC